MRVTLESTSKIVTIVVNGEEVPARIWEGETERGIKCHAYITRIAAPADADNSEFVQDLQEHAAPSAAVEAIPLRMII